MRIASEAAIRQWTYEDLYNRQKEASKRQKAAAAKIDKAQNQGDWDKKCAAILEREAAKQEEAQWDRALRRFMGEKIKNF